MKNYAIYYSYKEIGDVVIILFDNAKNATSSIRKNRVSVIYHNDEIIGYNIFDIKDIIKIKSEGMIYFPSNVLVSIINSVLQNEKLETLEYKTSSGYLIAQVDEIKGIDNEKFLLSLSIGNDIFHSVVKNCLLKNGDKVVIVQEGTFLNNGEMFKETNDETIKINAHVCTGVELGITNIDGILSLDNDSVIGDDFFLLEEK